MRRTTAIGAIAVPIVAAAATIATLNTAHAGQDDVTAAITTSHWSGGYGAEVLLTNDGDTAVSGWTIEIELPAGTTVSNHWSSEMSRDGQTYTFTPVSYNRDIDPGGTEDFGFNADGNGDPLSCTVNGNPCDGSGGGGDDTEPPTAPTGLTVTATTSGSVSLSWDASSDDTGVTGYDVHRDGTAVLDVSGTSATVTGLEPATTYEFTVTARDAAGNASAAGGPVTATTDAGGGSGDTIDVATGAELEAALADAQPGQTIRLASGEYHGAFLAQRGGTAAEPITLTGPRDAVLINDGASGSGSPCTGPEGDFDPGYGLWLAGAPYWNLTGFTIADSKKGLVIDDSKHVTVDGIFVHHIDQEAVHFRQSSADGVIRNSRIEETGLVDPGFGEGVYLGSAQSNFDCHGNEGGIDRSDRIQVLDNYIGPFVRGESIDIKEGTEGGLIRGNTFDGQGISGEHYADSWIDVKGSDYRFEDNTGTFDEPGTIVRGYAVLNLLDGYGCGNEFRRNDSDLGGVGEHAIWIHHKNGECQDDPNVVYSSNTVTGATQGLTNIEVTP
ncbi:cellulose binding domain-containing protein [Glycomyces salinus]|uniref:cellulose binding domain-containing protein n=1 Tax=Glycomyces salinus TaxID=980294 RepID=UPI0018EA6CF5|nr:cellulose binding domain-containing protein [Glycomyces salinus]